MNAGLSTFLTALGAVAGSAVLALTLADRGGEPGQTVQLDRVVIEAQRTPVEHLPRVVVEVHRLDGMRLAQTGGALLK